MSEPLLRLARARAEKQSLDFFEVENGFVARDTYSEFEHAVLILEVGLRTDNWDCVALAHLMLAPMVRA